MIIKFVSAVYLYKLRYLNNNVLFVKDNFNDIKKTILCNLLNMILGSISILIVFIGRGEVILYQKIVYMISSEFPPCNAQRKGLYFSSFIKAR